MMSFRNIHDAAIPRATTYLHAMQTVHALDCTSALMHFIIHLTGQVMPVLTVATYDKQLPERP